MKIQKQNMFKQWNCHAWLKSVSYSYKQNANTYLDIDLCYSFLIQMCFPRNLFHQTEEVDLCTIFYVSEFQVHML